MLSLVHGCLTLCSILLLLFMAKHLFFTAPPFSKSTPFECGFMPLHSVRTPFSMRFFLMALLFLIFDIELTFLLPFPIIPHLNALCLLTFTLFLIVLILGLLHEWREGSLNWAK